MTPYVYLAALSRVLIVSAVRAGKNQPTHQAEKPVLFSLSLSPNSRSIPLGGRSAVAVALLDA